MVRTSLGQFYFGSYLKCKWFHLVSVLGFGKFGNSDVAQVLNVTQAKFKCQHRRSS